ncbi:MAG: hypothetical protein WC710_15115 [Gallionella sp.]|jgi:hypothetical protein
MIKEEQTRVCESVAGPADFSWQCNECGSDELTSSISEDDLDWFACTNCGCPDFHREFYKPNAEINRRGEAASELNA